MTLNSIPQEAIAFRLDDKDLVSLRASCRAACAAIDARPAHFWMYKFKDHYDVPRAPYTLDDLRSRYQVRRKVLRCPPLFKHGVTAEENIYTRHLLDIVLDANPSTNIYGEPYSKNLELIDNIIQTTNVLQCIFQRVPKTNTVAPSMRSRKRKSIKAQNMLTFSNKDVTALQMFQLLLSARSLSFINPYPIIFSFPESQRAAYMDLQNAPLFGGKGGLEVNMTWALHIVNFFRFHMLNEAEATLFPAFSDLSVAFDGIFMPQLWKKKLSNVDDAAPIGRHWKGSYAYLSRREVDSLRSSNDTGSAVYEDHNVDMGHKALQELEVVFPCGKDTLKVWPESFEAHLNGEGFLVDAVKNLREGFSGTRNTRSAVPTFLGDERPESLKSHYYTVRGWDDETFWASGYITQLPTQKHIPGFKRMVMMKYFSDANGYIDMDALWAYEGIVLPGDQIIVGRWWSPETPVDRAKIYSGPFILWNTDCAALYKDLEGYLEDETMRLGAVGLTHG